MEQSFFFRSLFISFHETRTRFIGWKKYKKPIIKAIKNVERLHFSDFVRTTNIAAYSINYKSDPIY